MGIKVLLAAVALAVTGLLAGCGGGTGTHGTTTVVHAPAGHTCYHTTVTKTRKPVRNRKGQIVRYKTVTVRHTHVPYSC